MILEKSWAVGRGGALCPPSAARQSTPRFIPRRQVRSSAAAFGRTNSSPPEAVVAYRRGVGSNRAGRGDDVLGGKKHTGAGLDDLPGDIGFPGRESIDAAAGPVSDLLAFEIRAWVWGGEMPPSSLRCRCVDRCRGMSVYAHAFFRALNRFAAFVEFEEAVFWSRRWLKRL